MDHSQYSSRGHSSRSMLTKKNYLIAYNGTSLVLWAIITLRTVLLIPILFVHEQLYDLYGALHPLLSFTQSLAILEVIHSAVGIVRASPLTTAMQVASRLLVVWGVVGAFPEIVVRNQLYGVRTHYFAGTAWGPHAYLGILLAWGVTECIRYGFFVWKEGLGNGRVPKWLTWLRYVFSPCLTRRLCPLLLGYLTLTEPQIRYNTFFVLYPLGILSECCLIFYALKPADDSVPSYNLFLKAVLLIYVPGTTPSSPIKNQAYYPR